MKSRRACWTFACIALAMLSFAVPARADYENDPFDPVIARDAWLLIAQAERANGIPAGLLHAMSLVETGKGIRGWVLPWPYTLCVNSTGSKTYPNKEAALAAFTRFRALGFVRFNARGAGASVTKANGVQTASALGRMGAGPVTLEGTTFSRRFNNADETVVFINRLFAQGYRNVDVGMMQINWRVHGQHFSSVRQALEPTNNIGYAVGYLLEHRATRDWWGSVGRYHSGTSKYANRYIGKVYNMYLRIHRVSTS